MNIYQIQQDLLAIFDELEENGGELTPELEEKLTITQEEFKDKVEDYTNVIKTLDNDMSAIKVEQARLKTLYDRKEKVAKKLKEIIINAINEFGETKKSGVKYLDYGIGEVSVRKTPVVKVNETLIDYVGLSLAELVNCNKINNQLDVYDRINPSYLAERYNNEYETQVGCDDLSHINVDLSVSIPIMDLGNGKGYNTLKEIAKYTDKYKLNTSVSKTELKADLKENGACMPNLAKLDINESLQIK